MIGLALSYLKAENFPGKEMLEQEYHKIQTILFHVGAELGYSCGKDVKWNFTRRDVDAIGKAH